MASGRENFEIQLLRQGRWQTVTAAEAEAAALAIAKKHLADKACAGARVIRNWTNRDGTISETTLFEKTQTPSGDGPVRPNTIDSAPPRCERPRDYFALESRGAINRVLRNYFEQTFLTPTELLHNFKEIRRLQDKDSLLPSAVDMVAVLQVKGTDTPSRQRRDEILAALDQIAAQARRAEAMKLPKLQPRFSATIAEMAGLGGEAPEYLAMTALAKELIGIRNWAGKMDRLFDLIDAEPQAQSNLLLDTVVADLLGANVVQEILGWQPSLGSAIIAMLDLADGRFDAAKSDAKDTALRLNAHFAANRLPASRLCMIDRALRQLRSPQPLSRNDPGKEMDEYRRILERLMLPGGILSGAEAAEALTMRGSRMVEQGGASGRRAAITVAVKALPDSAHGVMYLAELSKTDLGKDHLGDIVEQLDSVFRTRVIGELCRRASSPKDRMVSATGAFNAAMSSALPDALKTQVAQHIDGVLERYLLDENIIDKLDHPDSHIRDRAVRLVKFCGAGVLPEGKALTLARKRVVQLLRMPKFDIHFVEGINDPVKIEKALRDFRDLLKQAGFG